MARLQIAFMNPAGEMGGAERALLLLLRGLDRRRYEPRVICFAPGRLVEALAEIDVPTRVVALGGAGSLSRFSGRRSLPNSLHAMVGLGRSVREILPYLRAHRPDVIHTNGIKAHLIGGVCGRLLQRPVLWHMRDLVPEGPMRRLFRVAANGLPQRIVTVSGAVTAQFKGCQAAAYARTVYDAVDVARYRPARPAAAMRAELGFSPGTVVLAMVAHFGHWKGHALFLEVVAHLLGEGLPIAGLIVGGSIYRTEGHQNFEAEVRARARALGLTNHVVFTGYQECVPDFLNVADILIHPPTRPEPFGLAVIEAMALRKPVVVAAAGGPLEIVEPGVTGLLVPPGDAAAFAQAVRSLIADPARRAAMGQRGRERVLQQFTPEIHLARIEQIYQEILP